MSRDGPDNGDSRIKLLRNFAQEYQGMLTRFFARRTHPEDVPDLVQDVFLRLSKLEDPEAIENPRNYIFRAASAALTDRARRVAVRRMGEHESFDENLPCVAGLSGDRVLQARDAARRMELELRAMPTAMRDVFVLRVFEGQKMADVARALGMSLRTAEKYYSKAMAQISLAVKDARP